MPSINGIEIKALKVFKDHEGAPCYQGNIYYNGKKLGFWSQDSWGGPDICEFDESLISEPVKAFVESDMVEDKYKEFAGLDSLLYELLKLVDTEKAVKQALKNGYRTYVEASDGYHVKWYMTPECKATVENSAYYKEFIADCKKDFFASWDGKVKIYDSVDDFIIDTRKVVNA